MTRPIFPLGDPLAADPALAGGKGASLGRLAAAGFPVPPGFVVSTTVCRDVFEALGLAAELGRLELGSPAERAAAARALQRQIVDAELPGPLAAAVRDAHARLREACGGDLLCAVRSSATAEDLPGASFAGQHGTYYYVDEARLPEMIRRCWASLWSPEAVAYRATHGVAHASVLMAVVVQEMIRSEVSGVAFTANPVSGDRGEIIIESCWGMGAALVDGRVTPDHYVLRRDGLEPRERRIAQKRFMVPARLDAGSETRLHAVPRALRGRETLGPHRLRTVAEWSLRCQDHFGAPQDVEWALVGDRFVLLQSRPITTLGRARVGDGIQGRWVLFKPLAENFTEPVTPLLEDLLMAPFAPAMRVIGGRVYADLRVYRPLVPFDLSDQELAEVLYTMFGASPPRLRLSLSRSVVAAVVGAGAYLTFAMALARTRAMPDGFMESFRALCREAEADAALGPPETFGRLFLRTGLLEPIGRLVVLVNLASLRFAPWIAVLRRLLARWAPELRPDAVALLCAGERGVLSAEMGREIAALAREARRAPAVAALIDAHALDQVLPRLREEPSAAPFLARFERFLAVHGHRAVREFELRAPRFDEDPAPVLAMIRNCVRAGTDADPLDRAARARAEVEAELHRALDALPLERPLRLRRRLIGLAAARARYYLKLRENSRYYHIMTVGVLRRKILRIEAELLADGRLRCRDDVFFLRWTEIQALRAGRVRWTDLEDRVRDRRLEHVRLSKLTPPRTIGIETRPTSPPASVDAAPGLAGLPASPGRYEGIARVILDPTVDASLDPGEVLVAPYTDPAWTPLFLTAGAAVVEVGSYLSHAGTVAREYGMPCIVDVTDCTRRIRTGDLVEVDGDHGRVRVLAPAIAS